MECSKTWTGSLIQGPTYSNSPRGCMLWLGGAPARAQARSRTPRLRRVPWRAYRRLSALENPASIAIAEMLVAAALQRIMPFSAKGRWVQRKRLSGVVRGLARAIHASDLRACACVSESCGGGPDRGLCRTVRPTRMSDGDAAAANEESKCSERPL